MKTNNVAKQIIRQNLEEALLRYDEYKKGYTIDDIFIPYIQMLDEIDAVQEYIYSKNSYSSKNEYEALKMFITRIRFEDIVIKMTKLGIDAAEVRSWFYGSEEREGFITAMFDKFLKMNRYCPFCNVTGVEANTSSYPLNGKVCPHREIEWMEEEG